MDAEINDSPGTLITKKLNLADNVIINSNCCNLYSQ